MRDHSDYTRRLRATSCKVQQAAVNRQPLAAGFDSRVAHRKPASATTFAVGARLVWAPGF